MKKYFIVALLFCSCQTVPFSYHISQEIANDPVPALGTRYALYTMVWHNSKIVWSKAYFSSDLHLLDSLSKIQMIQADTAVAILKRY